MKITSKLGRIAGVLVLSAMALGGTATASAAAPAAHAVVSNYQPAINTVSHCAHMEPGH